jgi:DNA-binding response OmpR family regulator
MVKIKLRVRMDRSIKILILDDSEIIRKTELKILKALGFKGPIYQAETVKAAEEIIKTEDIQFFILDWNLPDGTGLNYLKTIRKIDKFANCPVLMVTTEDEVGKMLEAIEEGASNYCTKPIGIEDFVEKFQGAYEKHYGSEERSDHDKTKTRNIKLQKTQTITNTVSATRSVPKDINFLVVDDSPSTLKAMQSALLELGFNGSILQAANVKAAKSLLAKNNVNMILCDWNMPGESGLDFLKYIRAEKKFQKLPFVMVTAQTDPGSILQAIEAGSTEYLGKPWDEGKLKKKIEASWVKFNAKSYKMRKE